MAGFFTSQLDYIFFVYGLAFLFLGVTCIGLRHPSQRFLPWGYVGVFGFLHGLHEWGDLLAMAGAGNLFLSVARYSLLIFSFASLVEFGRHSFARLGRRSPGHWIFLPLALPPLAGLLLDGSAGLDSGARYSLGITGCTWAAAALFLRARAVGAAAPRLRLAALFMLLYGVAAGLVVPSAAMSFGPWFEQQAFFDATGIPIQVLRAFLACGLAVTVWAYVQQRFEASPLREKRRRYFHFCALALSTTLLAGWLVTERLGTIYSTAMERQVNADLSLLGERIAGTTAVTRGLARTMSGSPWLAGLGAPLPSPRLDSLVDRYSRADDDLVAYIMDLQGKVVAASNRNDSTSLLGHNYAWRPYFQAARTGGEGGQFAVGATTGLPGFYASSPIRDRSGAIVGVAVIKKGFSASGLGLHHFENGYLVDRDGLVLLGGSAGAPVRLWPSAEDNAAQVGTREPLADHPLRDGERIKLRDGIYHVGIHAVPSDGWSVVVVQKETATLVSRLFGIAIALLISVLILLASFGMQREIGTEIQLHQKQQRLEELSERLERQAVTDTLTGAFNRLKFDEVLANELERSARYATPLALIMYDIDHFKRINDRYGHQAGDRVLAELTRLVSANTRISDTLARWGGEEFMIVVPQASEHEATALAEKLRHQVADASLCPEPDTCSYGVVQRRERDTVETITARADRALYQAKTAGRDRVAAA